MIRLTAIACLALAAAMPRPAAAQAADCFGGGLLVIDSITRGTQLVPRDPRSQRDIDTVSVSVSNVSTRQLGFRGTFQAPPVSLDNVAGKNWTLGAGQRTTIILGNVFKNTNEAVVRSALRLTCG